MGKCFAWKVRRRYIGGHQFAILSAVEKSVPHRSEVPGQSQLLQVVDKIWEIFDEGGAVDMVYLDFAKALDTVPHQRLLLKWESYGIGGEVYAWIPTFLNDRLQQVSVWRNGLIMGPCS